MPSDGIPIITGFKGKGEDLFCYKPQKLNVFISALWRRRTIKPRVGCKAATVNVKEMRKRIADEFLLPRL